MNKPTDLSQIPKAPLTEEELRARLGPYTAPHPVDLARWQGTARATGFAPQALPTARTARGAPMARAICV